MNKGTARGVIFDLFGTLVSGVQSGKFNTLIEKMAKAMDLSFEEFNRAWVETAEDRYRGKFRTIRENLEAVLRILGQRATGEGIQKAVALREAHTNHELDPKAESEKVLRKLRGRGLKIGLISDCSPGVPELWMRCSLSNLVDVSIFSSEVGLKKPDPKIFRLALGQLGLSAKECLYVGDGGSQELSGAAQVGLRPILLEPESGTVVAGYGWEAETWTGERVGNLSEIEGLLG